MNKLLEITSTTLF